MSNPYAQQGGNGWGNNPQGQQGYGQGAYGGQPQQQGYGNGQYGAGPQQGYGQNASNPYGAANTQNPYGGQSASDPTVAMVATPTVCRTRAATRRAMGSLGCRRWALPSRSRRLPSSSASSRASSSSS